MHCRPCFFCRVLLHSEQVAQLEKEPGTRSCFLLLLLHPLSLASFPFSFCCSFSRFLPCRGTRNASTEGGLYMQISLLFYCGRCSSCRYDVPKLCQQQDEKGLNVWLGCVAIRSTCVHAYHPCEFTLSLLKEPVILFLRELRVLLTLVPFSTFSVRSSSSSFLLK